MATVIYGQPDTRFGELGKALGGLAGGAVEGIAFQQASQGVAQIMKDPSIADSDKPLEVMKKFGPIGYQLFNQQVSTQAKQAAITGELARAKLADATTARAQAGLPFVAPQAQAQIQGEQARAGLATSEADKNRVLLPGEVQAQSVANVLGQQRALLTEQETAKTGAEARMVTAQARRYEQILANLGTQASPQTLDKMLDDAGVQDPTSRAAAKQAYASEAYSLDPSKADHAFSQAILGIATQRERGRAQAEKPTEAMTKEGMNSNESATSALRFMENFSKDPTKVGLLSGAPAKTWLERLGIGTGDVVTNELWNSSFQQIASTATSGGGFFANGRVTLASKTTPSIVETPLHALIAADQVADRQLARLGPAVHDHPEQKSLQDAQASWQEVKKITGTLQSYPVGSPDNQRNIVYFGGNQVDPISFKTLVKANAQYRQPNGAVGSGADLISKAIANKRDPLEVIQQYGLEEVK